MNEFDKNTKEIRNNMLIQLKDFQDQIIPLEKLSFLIMKCIHSLFNKEVNLIFLQV